MKLSDFNSSPVRVACCINFAFVVIWFVNVCNVGFLLWESLLKPVKLVIKIVKWLLAHIKLN